MSAEIAATVPLIEFERVRKSYGPARPVLRGLSFSVDRGQFVVLTGANGAGKSTVLQLIAGWLAPDEGRVVVAGTEPARLRGAALAALRRAIGIVPQQPTLLADRSVLENVMLPALAAGMRRGVARERARAALLRVGLEDDGLPPSHLSVGQWQRAALARAMVNRPALLLVDGVTAHQDAASAAQLLALLAQFAQAGVTVVLATHGEPAPLPESTRRLHLLESALAA